MAIYLWSQDIAGQGGGHGDMGHTYGFKAKLNYIVDLFQKKI